MNHTKALLSLTLLLALHCSGFSQDTIFTSDGAFLEVKIIADYETKVHYRLSNDLDENHYLMDKVNITRISRSYSEIEAKLPVVQTAEDSVLQTYKRLIKLQFFGPTTFGYEQLLSPRMSFEIAGSLLELNLGGMHGMTTGGFIRAGLKLATKKPGFLQNRSNPLASKYFRIDLAYSNLSMDSYLVNLDTTGKAQSIFDIEKRESFALLAGVGVQLNISPRIMAGVHLVYGAAYSELNSRSNTYGDQHGHVRAYGSHNAGGDHISFAYRLGWSISYLLK
jgi:hypothetical protein